MKHDAKLAHQNLRLSRGTDVFTISSGGRGVSVYLMFSYASGPPIVKLDAILFGVSCRDNLFMGVLLNFVEFPITFEGFPRTLTKPGN